MGAKKSKKRKKAKGRIHYSPFAWRRVVLSQMGYSSYAQYLKSDLWKGIRDRVLSRDRNACRYCSLSATQAHHRNYRTKTLNGANITYMLAICGACHKFISKTSSGKVASMEQMKRRTVVLINAIRGNRV